MKKVTIKLLIFLFSLIVLVVIIKSAILKQSLETQEDLHLHTLDIPLEQFIWTEMVSEKGLLKTTLKRPSDDYALSESLGLWMEYAVMSDNEPLFQEAFQLLEEYFLSKEGLVHWRVLQNGKTTENVNAFLDDIRIVTALLDANEKWGSRRYSKTAKEITRALRTYGTYDNTFIDFYDWKHKEKSHSITTTYLDIKSIQRLEKSGWIDTKTLENMKRIAERTAEKGTPLFPKSYNLDQKQFTYEDTVNMSEQVYTAYHLTDANYPTHSFYTFIKKEFERHGKLYGQYNRLTLRHSVDYESPALYGLAILYALEMNDHQFAQSLYERLSQFSIKNDLYDGVYMDTNTFDTHIFDNLIPLIAERRLIESEIIR